MQNDDWRPVATLETLHRRAHMLADIRAFFAARNVLEVETPVLSHAMNPDPAIASFVTEYCMPGVNQGTPLWLHTSPEFPMKRLLAAGSGSIYQICKVFRNGEAGRMHNPEFTMLEWYRMGFGIDELMAEVETLVKCILGETLSLLPTRRRTYRSVFMELLGLDPLTANEERLSRCASDHDIHINVPLCRDEWLDLLMSHLIEPRLEANRLEFIYDYPASQASLARIKTDEGVAERFELYLNGMELANGFNELTDALEQRKRFEADIDARRHTGRPLGALDDRLLQALVSGLPACSGVALGIDRLLMTLLGSRHIHEVLAFPAAWA